MLESAREVEQLGRHDAKDEKVPEDLKLGYRDELGEMEGDRSAIESKKNAAATTVSSTTSLDTGDSDATNQGSPTSSMNASQSHQTAIEVRSQRRQGNTVNWLDIAIACVGACLLVLVLRKLARVL